MVREYLSPSDYKRAEMEYGIPRALLNRRFNENGWDRERAITEPVDYKAKMWDNFKEIAEANGIGRETFRSRVNKCGYCPGKAATKPVLGKKGAEL